MTVQIILKNSSVVDKRPAANQLANGELSLNYNEAGAFLCCRDTEGNIQQVGGIKISSDAPGSPVRGTMWLQPATSTLFIYNDTGWLSIAGGGGGGGGGGDITQVLGGDGITTSELSGVVTVNANIDTDRGLNFVGGQIAINPGANISFDAQGRLRAEASALAYRGTVDLVAGPVPADPTQGDTHANIVNGDMSADWQTATGEGATQVAAGDLVVWNGTIWTYIPTGGVPGDGTDLTVDNRTATALDIASSTGDDATVPAATDALAGLMTSADKTRLDGMEDGAQANVQADWNETDSDSDAFIDNKPTIPAAQVQSNWTETDNTDPSFIQNKPTIPAAQVQSDWDETDTLEPSFILNKPTIPDPTDPPDTGDFGYWNRTGTVLSPATDGDDIVTTGSIGVGTDAPTRNLVVNGGASEGVLKVTNDTSGTALAEGLDIIHFVNGETDIHNRADAALRFSTNNTERARITAAGVFNLGDGTTNAVSLNPGTTGRPLVRDANGRLLVGAETAPHPAVNRLIQQSHANGSFYVAHNSTADNGINAWLGGYQFSGIGGADTILSCQINAQTDGQWSSTSAPGRLEFLTTPGGEVAAVERLRIDSLGRSNFFGAIYAGNFNTIPAGDAWDLAESNIWAFGGNGVINDPDNLVSGTSGLIWVTGTITGWGGAFRFPGGTPIAPAANSVVPYFVTSNTDIRLGSPVEGIA